MDTVACSTSRRALLAGGRAYQVVASTAARNARSVLEEVGGYTREAGGRGADASLTETSAGHAHVGAVEVVAIGTRYAVREAVALDTGWGTCLANSVDICEVAKSAPDDAVGTKKNLGVGTACAGVGIPDAFSTLSATGFALKVGKIESVKTGETVDRGVVFPTGGAGFEAAEESYVQLSYPDCGKILGEERKQLKDHGA